MSHKNWVNFSHCCFELSGFGMEEFLTVPDINVQNPYRVKDNMKLFGRPNYRDDLISFF